jgi:glycosyltransferase involved in cell wall biosynthesis
MVGFQSNVIAIGLGLICRIPVAVRLSNHFAAVRHERSALRKLSEWMKRITYRHADRVIANSEELARDYAAVLHTEVLTVPNPVDFARIRQLVSEPVEEVLFADRQRPLVITAGRLAAQKNYPMLLRAMAEVVAELPCDLVILGEGEERGRLERLVGELGLDGFVHLPGYRRNVYAHFHRADLFVLSSNYEGMPNVLIEAIACGLPAVATRCKTGPTEILCDGRAGELVPVGDHHALAGAILRALRDPAAAQARHAVAAAHIRNYDLATIEAQYRQLVTAILPAAAKN